MCAATPKCRRASFGTFHFKLLLLSIEFRFLHLVHFRSKGVRIHKNGRIDLRLRRAGLNARNAKENFIKLDEHLTQVLAKVPDRCSGKFDVSCNRMDDAAVEQLMEICIKHDLLYPFW